MNNWILIKYQKIERIFLDHALKIIYIIIILLSIILFTLSFFRFALYDERLYLHETVIMAELIKQGKWYGNYGVGLHGSLFKLPVALAYVVTGPSVEIATIFHVILAGFSVLLFFRILWEHFKLRGWSLLGLLLFITTYSFLSWSITYHRETPALFATLFFLKRFLEKKNDWILGLLLILVIEAKEYVFFLISPPLIVWCILSCYINYKKISVLFIRDSVVKCLKIFLPTTIYLIVMFTTNIIPVNMFTASIMGLTKNAITYQTKHITPMNYDTKENSGLYISMSNSIEKSTKPTFLKQLCKLGASIVGYTEKSLYLSSFSFQSIPMFILIFSFIYSLELFNKWKISNENSRLFIILFYWFYLLVYFLKVSQQRYMFPLSPMSTIVLILALKNLYDKKYDKRFLVSSIVATLIYTLGLFLYQSNDPLKTLFEIYAHIIILFTITLFYLYRKRILIIVIAFEIIFSGLLYFSASAILKNQLYKSLTWGINGETDKIARMVSMQDIIYINGTNITDEYWMYNLKFFRKDPYLVPQWKWNLHDFIPKKKNLLILGKENTYDSIKWNNLDGLKNIILTKKIDKIIMVVSTVEGVKFYNQDYIADMTHVDWLTLEQVKYLKNKNVYVFGTNLQ